MGYKYMEKMWPVCARIDRIGRCRKADAAAALWGIVAADLVIPAMQQEALNTLQLLYREAGGPDGLTGTISCCYDPSCTLTCRWNSELSCAGAPQQEVNVQDAPAPVQLSLALPSSASSHQQGPVDLSEGQLVQPLPRPPSLMSPATLKRVGLGPPSQPTWSFQHATSGVFAPVHELPGSRVAPALGLTASVPQSQPPALHRPGEGHPLSSSSGSLQLSCQLPPGSRWPAPALAAHLKPAQPSDGTSSDMLPSGSTHRGAASDEGVASGGDSRGLPSQQQPQQGLGPSMRQVDSESSLAQQDGSGSDREEGAAKRRRTKKSRLVWTPELHQRFINAVTHLVGPYTSACRGSEGCRVWGRST